MTKRRFDASHFIAGLLGGGGLFFSKAINTAGAIAYVLPIASALVFAWLLTAFLPRWTAAAFVVVVSVVAVWNAKHIGDEAAERQRVLMLGYEIGDVCDGKPLGKDPEGPRMVIYDRYPNLKHWAAANYTGKVPAFVLCKQHLSQPVSCGDFVEQGGDQRTQRICTSREDIAVELRRAKTAEVLLSRTYYGANPASLGSFVQRGGPGATKLSGDTVAPGTIHADVKAVLDAQP